MGDFNGASPMPGHVFVEFQHRRPDKVELRKGGLLKRKVELHLPEPKQEGAPTEGVVLAVHDDVTDIKVGDYVYFTDDNPQGFEWNKVKVLNIKAENVAGIRNA